MTENEVSERYEEPSVPQYQIQIEKLDFQVKQLRGNLFILQQEHTREQIKINSKIESAKRALEKPLKDIEAAKNSANSNKGEEVEKINKEIEKVENLKQKTYEKINKLEENLYSKYSEENEIYEKMSMLENDILSTEVEIKKMEEEIPKLDKKTESISKTYPPSFKKLTDDFILFDKKSRIEINIKEIENKIILQNYKVKEFKDIKSTFDDITEKKEGNAGDVELKKRLNEERQNEIDNLVSSITQGVNQILQIEKFFPMFDSYFNAKNYIDNKVYAKTIKNIVIPFVKEILEKYTEMNNEQIDIISQHEKEISDLNDMKPSTMQIKRDIKIKKNKLKEEKSFSDYLNKLISSCEAILEKFKPIESKPDTDCIDMGLEIEFFQKLKEIILISAEGNKEEMDKNYEDYLETKEEKVRDSFFLEGGSKDANSEFDEVKNQASSLDDIVKRHENEIEQFNKDKKVLQDELKALNDTINLRSRELKNSLSKFTQENFSDYFNCNKDLLKLLLFKEKKSIVKNNQYELTKENIQENVLVDHSRKKTNMYIYLKKKYLYEYLCHLYSEDNLDSKGMNERTKKAYGELATQINKLLEEINTCKEEVNNYDEQIMEKNNQADNVNNGSNTVVEELNEKVQELKNNLLSLENEKYQEQSEFETKKYNFEEQIKQLLQEIQELEEILNNKLNVMTSGIINLYLKYDDNTKNYNPEKDKFNPTTYGYSLREFEFQPQNGTLLIKDLRNKIVEKKIKYDLIKRISLDADSVKTVEEIESKPYSNEKEKNKDPLRKKKIKLFVTLRRSNLDIVAKEYNDYKKFVDIINSIVIHK